MTARPRPDSTACLIAPLEPSSIAATSLAPALRASFSSDHRLPDVGSRMMNGSSCRSLSVRPLLPASGWPAGATTISSSLRKGTIVSSGSFDAGPAELEALRREAEARQVGHGFERAELAQGDRAIEVELAGGARHGAYDICGMAARKPRASPSLSPVRRTTPSLEGVEAPQREAATVSEQKINQYRKRRYQALHADTEAANRRRAAGKATARDRIEMLLDEGSFVELDVFATHRAVGFGMEERKIAGDGVVAGFRADDRRPVAVYAYDATVFGGSLGEVTAEKIVKVQELAVRNRVPIIGINDSGGARIQEGVVALAGYADIFFRNVRSSGVIPQLSVIAGPCTGGAVYSPAITDFIFIVADSGYMFITGPEVVRVTTGEEVSFDQLGGGEVHNTLSGVAHFLAQDEAECWRSVRQLLSYLPSSNAE